ncbi:SMAD/FHA domain-containing protein [Leucogyrophana mollusca]|uniref:SMAD/FHA domain-containing protein n=1 Tax=Leucogyrophana mollusca TaxID=85980 RepID=A0ACB8AXW4_9AGAM|nr:SMAD/FHA domain-containing protein [Leucogyrophana mollusca]
MQAPAQIPSSSKNLLPGDAAMSNSADVNAHLWGFLLPCSSTLRGNNFRKTPPDARIGRAPNINVVLPGVKVSKRHCKIMWDGKEDKHSIVTVTDFSSNGTWINGTKTGKDKTAILKDGSEIAFGLPGWPQSQPRSEEDYPKAFVREISILENLNHPTICQLKEVFLQDASTNLILKTKGLEERMARHITSQIADVMVVSRGYLFQYESTDLSFASTSTARVNPPIVKLAGFGLAYVVDKFTFLQTMCGTTGYVAPEVVVRENHEGYNRLVDSWSVGVIVFSMLTISSPLIEDDIQRDMKIRIAKRTIDWTSLEQAECSAGVRDSTRHLVDVDARMWMSLADAQKHL